METELIGSRENFGLALLKTKLHQSKYELESWDKKIADLEFQLKMFNTEKDHVLAMVEELKMCVNSLEGVKCFNSLGGKDEEQGGSAVQ